MPADAPGLRDALKLLVERRALEPAIMRAAMQSIVTGSADDAMVAALLAGLRVKGETPEELAAAIGVLREHMIPFDTVGREVLDTCGTGGDLKGTFNISTAAACVAAACGVPVVKHGNRAVSGVCGSADVLTTLGVKIDPPVEVVQRCLREAGMAFCFAPRFHPAMRHVADVRRRLGFRTIFNLMGPLLNPAGAKYQLIGVGSVELLDTLAETLRLLGTANAYLVCGSDGLDEVTLGGATFVRHVQDGAVRSLEWTPADFDLPACSWTELRVANAAESAEQVRAIVEGHAGPATNVVFANAAAALMAARVGNSLSDAVVRARQAVAEGRARQVLNQLVRISNEEWVARVEG